MNRLYVLYHMARADFFERARRYSFLVMLGMVVWLGYASATGRLVMSVQPNYVGEINSAWVGALMTVTVTLFLGWFGFYLVKGSVSRDYETGVGQIMATTPLSRPLYALGKWLSNFLVLGVMLLILMAAGVLMIVLVGEAPLDLGALAAPLLFIALPCMGIVAAAAVAFETVGWLRGGFGNVVYFFLFVLLLSLTVAIESYHPMLDFTGLRLVGESVSEAAQHTFPESGGGFSFQILNTISDSQRFRYEGIEWTPDVLLPRAFLMLVAFGLAMLASLFFDRFNSSRDPARKKKRSTTSPADANRTPPAAVPHLQAHLTPLPAERRFRFFPLYIAELRLLLKGHRWWWYLISLGLIIAQFAAPADTRPFLLAIAWLWMILMLSGLGSREALHNTREIVFSAPRPVLNQLPALWLSAVTVTGLMGSGALLRYLLDGETTRLVAGLAGALFVPSLAVALGTLTSSRKPFEAIYVTWMYLVLNEAGPLDFVGVTPDSPWQVYLLLAVCLVLLAGLIRHWQLTLRGE